MRGAEEFDLVMAVIRGDADEVRRAHDAGVDLATVTAPGGSGSLLGWAAEWGRTEILAYLLSHGIEAESHALSRAAHKGHAEAVRLLLDHGMNPDLPTAWPPLCAAADRGSPECVQALLEAGARVDVRAGPQSGRWGGKTPRELATMRPAEGTAEILRLLTSPRLDST
ncbi:ankyrin repeat domain-containing protein [Nocardia cyriacigeorgica]|uniref:Ankyrin repeat domain-containing protein n=2 Tax=Nocardia cyriacigeorgica TaxID=135487 RepID=A0A6P1D0U9_9NOCA|nr:ankyrin repeat domain-containing protein [Nocardia cyriacigeorgica]NEW43214.1 ankyrin repeat domain-containing protein [Nocardia cyriacigeorgica]NEW49791.1 ankyrin repeat domain-containing protein [Nocardia cyriacigeorgica]